MVKTKKIILSAVICLLLSVFVFSFSGCKLVAETGTLTINKTDLGSSHKVYEVWHKEDANKDKLPNDYKATLLATVILTYTPHANEGGAVETIPYAQFAEKGVLCSLNVYQAGKQVVTFRYKNTSCTAEITLSSTGGGQ